jgi:hypothetical protein
MDPVFLEPHELARRWRISSRSLERFRQNGQGPAFVKIGNSVRYPIAAVREFEQRQAQAAEAHRTARAKPNATGGER